MSNLLEKLGPVPGQSGPDWLSAVRRDARKQLMKYGFPTLKTEDWKYTSLRTLEKQELQVGRPCLAGEDVNSRPSMAGLQFVWQNGILTVPDKLPAGIRLTSIADLDEQRGRALLEQDFGGPEGAFAWLNTDQFEDGWLLEITQSPEQPLLLEFHTDEDYAAACHPRLIVKLADQVRADVIEWHEGQGSGLLNIVMTTQVSAGAHLDYTRFQNTGLEACVIQRHDLRLARDAGITWTALDLGGRLIRHDLNVDLSEAGSACRVNGAFVTRGRSHLDHHTRITHSVGHTQSRENFRGILTDRGHGVFNGKIIMQPGADGSDSDLNSANLLLSPDARIDTKPELEIHAEEVKASHGATVGAMDEAALFYLQSRGLPREQAISLLKHAFVGEVVDKVSPPALRRELSDRLKRVLDE